MSKLDFLSGASAPSSDAPVISTAPPEAAASTTPPADASSAPARDDRGRFASPAPAADGSAAPASAGAPGAETTPPASGAAAAPDPHADIRAQIAREYEEKYSREISGLRAAAQAGRVKAREARQPAAPPPVWTDDDLKFHQAEVGAVASDLVQDAHERVSRLSFEKAEGQHGKDVMLEVAKWSKDLAGRDPAFNERMLHSADPYQEAHDAYQDHQFQIALRDPTFRAQILALRNGQPAPGGGQPAPTHQPASAPRSIIHAASTAGGAAHVPTGAGQAYDTLFKG